MLLTPFQASSPPDSTPPTTWVFHHGALGDSVILWPFLRDLAPLHFAAAPSKAALASLCIPGITPVDGQAPYFSSFFAPSASPDLPQPLRESLHDATRIISFIASPADPWAENVRRLAPRANLYFASPPSPADLPQPIALHYQQQLARQSLHLTLQPPSPIAPYDPAGPILIHPGSGSPRKSWPPDRFDLLFQYLHRLHLPFSIILGEVELHNLPPALIRQWPARYHVIRQPELEQLAWQLANASLFIGNDSGPTHLAAQLGIPTLAIFGPTDPKIWMPTAPRTSAIHPDQPGDITWLSLDLLLDAIRKTLASIRKPLQQ